MTGWAIFRKSITQIYYNLNDAIRLSGLLWLVSFIVSLLPMLLVEPVLEPSPADAIAFIGVFIISLICIIWIAILWHRFMLLEESLNTAVPVWRSDLIWSYFKAAMLIGLIMVAAAMIPLIIFSFFANLLIQISIWLFSAVIMALGVTFYYFSLRISLILPAAAIEKPMSIGDSWRATEPASNGIFVASLLFVLFNFVLQAPFMVINASQLVTQIVSFFSGWVLVMVSVTLLTTLYGHLIEKRPLD